MSKITPAFNVKAALMIGGGLAVGAFGASDINNLNNTPLYAALKAGFFVLIGMASYKAGTTNAQKPLWTVGQCLVHSFQKPARNMVLGTTIFLSGASYLANHSVQEDFENAKPLDPYTVINEETRETAADRYCGGVKSGEKLLIPHTEGKMKLICP